MHFAVEVWKKFSFTCLVINKLLCGAPIIALQVFPPRGRFCCHFGLFRGLVSVGDWYCLLVERIYELEILQRINVVSELQ